MTKRCRVYFHSLLSGLFAVACAVSHETRLVEDLLRGYDPAVRPVKESNTILVVTQDIAIRQILKLDETDQVMISAVWMRLFWTDEFLTWNVSQYGGVTEIRIAMARVWLPDITLYSSVNPGGIVVPDLNKVVVSPNGRVAWLYPTVIKTSCTLNVLYFPFDRQECRLRFGSWSYTSSFIDIVNLNGKADYSAFLENGEWELVDVPAQKKVFKYACCEDSFPFVDFDVILQRFAFFHIVFLILPFLLIVCVTVMGFLIPVEMGDKLALAATNLLSVVVLQLLVAERLPPQASNIPIIGNFFTWCMIILGVVMFLHIVVLNIHKGSTKNGPPAWLKKITNCFSKEVLGKLKLKAYVQNDGPTDTRDTMAVGQYRKDEAYSDKNKLTNHFGEHPMKDSSAENIEDMALLTGFTDHLRKMSTNVARIVELMDRKRRERQLADEWKDVAAVLDKLFFVVLFLIITTMATFVMVKAAYHL